MKVLAVSASPRIGGNSDILCDQFLKGAEEAGYEAEKISLSKMKLSPCTACYGCRRTAKCVQKDEMEEALEKLIQADTILLATPVYFYSMDAQMKIFIDRCLPRYEEIRNKDFYFAVAAADLRREAMEPALAGLRGYLDCLPGAKEKGVFYGTGAWEKGDIIKLPVMQTVYEVGKRL